MSPSLAQFVFAHAVRVPSGTYAVKDLLRDFLAQLPPSASREAWRRSRLIAELTSAGFIVALDQRTRVYSVAGLAPRAELQAVEGELTRAV